MNDGDLDVHWRDHLGVGMASASAIVGQVALTRVLSITLWHHFAYLVVGLALLGFGVAGSWLTSRGGAVLDDDGGVHRTLARRARTLGWVSLVAVLLALSMRTNPLELFRSISSPVTLAAVVVLCTVPFLGSGVVIGTALSAWSKDAGKVYAADLVGGGVAGASCVLLIPVFGGLGLLGLATVLLAASAVLFGWRTSERKRSALVTGLMALACLGLMRDEDAWIVPAPTKELTLFHRPEVGVRVIEHRAWTPHGRIDVAKKLMAPPLVAGEVKVAPGLWPVHMVTQDGAAPTTIHGYRSDPAELNFLYNSSTSAVWELRGAAFGPSEAHVKPGPNVLVIGVGGGVDIMNALAHGAGHVTGAEINPEILRLLTTRYRDFAGGVAARDDVKLVNADGRAFVRGSDKRFDVIQLAGVDTFTALASGAYSLAEAYVYTLEAFDDFFAHLTDTGCLSVSRLILDPPRETLRLAVTADFALRRAGVRRAYRHITVLRADLWSTLVACRQPIDPVAMQRMRAFAARGQFRIVFDPERPKKDEFTRALVGSKTERFAFFDAYRYRVLPARDEAPFFFNYFRLRDLGRVRSMHSESMYGTAVPIGHGVLLLTLFVTVLLGAIGILRPLRRFEGLRGSSAFGVYFACLGFGFLLVEIALIQRLTFFLGHPTYALTVVLSGLLVASGVGAAMSKWGFNIGVRLFALIAVVLFGAAAFSYWGLPRQVGLDFNSRLGVSVLLIAPLGVALGMPLPAGIACMKERGLAQLIPWGFGVNAFATVVASAVTPLIALSAGFSALFSIAAGIYVVAGGALYAARRTPPQAEGGAESESESESDSESESESDSEST